MATKKCLFHVLMAVGIILLVGVVIWLIIIIPNWILLLSVVWLILSSRSAKNSSRGSGSLLAVWLGASLLKELLSTKQR